MRVVKGIYDDNDQLMMLATLTNDNPMMGVIFYTGVVSGLRIGDLLSLKAHEIGREFYKKESKTGKIKKTQFPPEGWELIKTYIELEDKKPHDRLFKTTRQTVHKYFMKAANDIGLYHIGTHSMRKTFG
jgi:integrase